MRPGPRERKNRQEQSGSDDMRMAENSGWLMSIAIEWLNAAVSIAAVNYRVSLSFSFHA
jgi:hypothetical protein